MTTITMKPFKNQSDTVLGSDKVNLYIGTHKMEAASWPSPCHKPKPDSA